MALKIGDRIEVWNGPTGRGDIVAGPDEQGNWLVDWDLPWDGNNDPTWEAVEESMKVTK